MSDTSRLDLPYPAGSNPPNGPAQLQAMADQIDSIVVGFYEPAPAADRPAAGVGGMVFYASDSEEFSYDNGSSWIKIGPINTTNGNIESVALGGSDEAGSSGLSADASHVHAGPSAASVLGLIWPIDSVLFSESSTNPGTSGYFETGVAFGTWAARAAGRNIKGVGEGTDINSETLTVSEGAGGDTIGEYVHRLSAFESGVPVHTHPTADVPNGFVQQGGADTANVTTGGGGYNLAEETGENEPDEAADAHNNVEPYYGLYIWARTA